MRNDEDGWARKLAEAVKPEQRQPIARALLAAAEEAENEEGHTSSEHGQRAQ